MTIRKVIPAPLLAVCAEIAARRETHATLDSLFTYAGASGEPPEGSKPTKALAWLRATNKDANIQPLDVLGRLIENYMEGFVDPEDYFYKDKIKDREKLIQLLGQCELQYIKGGKIVGTLGSPSRTLEEFVREKISPQLTQSLIVHSPMLKQTHAKQFQLQAIFLSQFARCTSKKKILNAPLNKT